MSDGTHERKAGCGVTDPSPAPVVGFKWTNAEGRSWHDGTFGPWESGKTYSVADAEKNGPCGRGIHIGKTAADAIGYGRFPGRLFSVRATGPVLGQDETKWRVGSVELRRGAERIVRPDRGFIASIKTVSVLQSRQRPLKKWKHRRGALVRAARNAASARRIGTPHGPPHGTPHGDRRTGRRIGRRMGRRMGRRTGRRMGRRIGRRTGRRMGRRTGRRIGRRTGPSSTEARRERGRCRRWDGRTVAPQGTPK